MPRNFAVPTTMYGSSFAGPVMYQNLNTTLHTLSSDKGKAKAQDADFEAAFAHAVASLSVADTHSSSRIVELGTTSTTVEPVSEDAKLTTDFAE